MQTGVWVCNSLDIEPMNDTPKILVLLYLLVERKNILGGLV